MKAVVIYWSSTGNTKKTAESIQAGLKEAGWSAELLPVADAEDIDFFDYDLVCFGTPSINWHVPKPVETYLKGKFAAYKKAGVVVPGCPRRPGKNALLFVTFSGPHTGIREAEPAALYMGQFFEHFGFTVADIFYVLGEFSNVEENNTQGRMGNIKGRPSEEDLARVRTSAFNLAQRLSKEAEMLRAFKPN